MNMEHKLRLKNGEVKYYASYRTAWNKAAKLNEDAVGGLWFFEGDEHGWFVFFSRDEDCQ